jgi:hypothetical protein
LKSGFDPYVAILMAYLVKLKTQPTENAYATGVKFLKMVEYLKMIPSDPLIQVIEEYDRVLSVRWEEHGGALHWSRGDQNRNGLPPDWGDDLDSITIQLGLTWTVTVRETHNAPVHRARQADLPLPLFNTVNRPGLPLIAYPIKFHHWGLWACKSDSVLPTPDVETLHQLLNKGFDPNEYFQGHTIWEYTLYQVHTHKEILPERGLGYWLQVFKVMLIHGADPYTCCLHDPGDFKMAICLVDKPSPWFEKGARKHLQPDSGTHIKRGFDSSAWDIKNTHSYHHYSVTAVVADVFSCYEPTSTKELKEVLETRKRPTTQGSQKRKREDDNQDEPWSSKWVS